jgi:hypothetical protein
MEVRSRVATERLPFSCASYYNLRLYTLHPYIMPVARAIVEKIALDSPEYIEFLHNSKKPRNVLLSGTSVVYSYL